MLSGGRGATVVVAAGEEDIEGVALPIGPFKYSQKRAQSTVFYWKSTRGLPKKSIRTRKNNLGLKYCKARVPLLSTLGKGSRTMRRS